MRLIDARTLQETLESLADDMRGEPKAYEAILDAMDMVDATPTEHPTTSIELVIPNDKLEEAVERVMNREVGGWIPCSERMPEMIKGFRRDGDDLKTEEFSKLCLVTAKTRFFSQVAVAQLHDGKWNAEHIGEIIAWQPLPEPYKEE